MRSEDKQKKFSKEDIASVIDRELRDEPYKDRLKEELLNHLEDQEVFGQISGQKKTHETLGSPLTVTLLCKSFLSRKKSRLAFILLGVLICVLLVNFVWYAFFPNVYATIRPVITVVIEVGLIIAIAYLLPSFRAKDLW